MLLIALISTQVSAMSFNLINKSFSVTYLKSFLKGICNLKYHFNVNKRNQYFVNPTAFGKVLVFKFVSISELVRRAP